MLSYIRWTIRTSYRKIQIKLKRYIIHMDTQKDIKKKSSQSSQNLSSLETKGPSSHKEDSSSSPLKIAKQLSIASGKAKYAEALEAAKIDLEGMGGISNHKQFFSPQIHPHWSELSGLAPLRLNEDIETPEEESSKNLFLNFAQPFVIGVELLLKDSTITILTKDLWR